MSLYDSIASCYDLVFPVRPPKVAFAISLAGRSGKTVLDIGCATGSLVLELARKGFEVTGIDLDADMIRLAAGRAHDQNLTAAFEELDMRRMGERFSSGAFTTVLCLGNTVVHLEDASAIGSFLREVHRILATNGMLALQFVNYERVMAGEIESLPTIDNEHIRFTRAYRIDRERRRVLFSTELTLKEARTVHRDETCLYPLTPTELLTLLGPAGFTLESCHADFTGRPFSSGDDSLIAVLRPAGA